MPDSGVKSIVFRLKFFKIMFLILNISFLPQYKLSAFFLA